MWFCDCNQLHGNRDDQRKEDRRCSGTFQHAVVEALDGLPTHKIHCSVLAEEAVKAAVKDYYDKNGIPYDKEKFKEVSCAHCE